MEMEASLIWEMGKDKGLVARGVEAVIINKVTKMETRDRENCKEFIQLGRVEGAAEGF